MTTIEFEAARLAEIKKVKHYNKQHLSRYQSLKKDDWHKYLKMENEALNFIDFKNPNSNDRKITINTPENLIATRVKFNDFLLNHQLPYISARYGTKSFMFTYLILSYLASPIGLILILFICGLSLYQKYTKKQFGLLLTNQIPRSHILIVDWCIYLLKALAFTSIMLLFSFILGFLLSGSMSAVYPIIESGPNIKLVPIYQEILKLLILLLCLLSFSYLLGQLILILTKNVNVSILVLVTLLFTSSVFFTSEKIIANSWSAVSPATY